MRTLVAETAEVSTIFQKTPAAVCCKAFVELFWTTSLRNVKLSETGLMAGGRQ